METLLCSKCDSEIDVPGDVDEGDRLECVDCDAVFEVVGVFPLEIEAIKPEEDDSDLYEEDFDDDDL